jgi:VanZ family protein
MQRYISRASSQLLSRVGLAIVVGIFLLLFGFGSTPASGNLVAAPWDKVVHLAVFATLTIGLRAVLPTWSIYLIAALSLVTGAADELHQYFVPTRHPGLDDWLADAVGTVCGLMLWRWLEYRQSIKVPFRA